MRDDWKLIFCVWAYTFVCIRHTDLDVISAGCRLLQMLLAPVT